MTTCNIALTAGKHSLLNGHQDHFNKDAIMKPNAWKLALLSTAIVGFAGNASAAATQFTATATVQNAVTITQTTPLNFGTVFATATGAPVTPAAYANSHKLTLSSAGVVTETAGTVGTPPRVLSLGGATVGSFSAPGLPSNGTVKITFADASGAAFTNAIAGAETCGYDTPSLATAAHKIVLANGADPTTGFFCVDVFTTNRTGLTGAGYALGFGVTTLTFDLGATLIAQNPLIATARTFQSGAYSGSFGMEVTFP